MSAAVSSGETDGSIEQVYEQLLWFATASRVAGWLQLSSHTQHHTYTDRLGRTNELLDNTEQINDISSLLHTFEHLQAAWKLRRTSMMA